MKGKITKNANIGSFVLLTVVSLTVGDAANMVHSEFKETQGTIAPTERESSDVTINLTSDPSASSVRVDMDDRSPALVCVLVDFTASISRFGVRIPTVDDIMPLLKMIDERGGEIGVGSITEDSSSPLLRLRLRPPAPGLRKPDLDTDVFTRRKRLKRYREQLPEYEAKEKERRVDNKKKIEAFVKRLQVFLETRPDRNATDLFGQMRRAETFLMEDPAYWTAHAQEPPSRHLVIVSDGRHTVESSTYHKLEDTISVAAVSGVGGLGDLTKIGRRVRWFESAASAVDFTITNAGRGE